MAKHVTADVVLDRAQVRAMLKGATSVVQYVTDLYKVALPEGIDWDAIVLIDVWPKVNKETGLELTGLARDADERLGSSFPGGTWMNKGFSTYEGDDLPNWTVRWDTDMDFVEE